MRADNFFPQKGANLKSQIVHCVRYEEEQLSWEDARDECMKKNGDLATIADQATNDFVTNSFPISFTFWIGGVRKSGKRTWTDGTEHHRNLI